MHLNTEKSTACAAMSDTLAFTGFTTVLTSVSNTRAGVCSPNFSPGPRTPLHIPVNQPAVSAERKLSVVCDFPITLTPTSSLWRGSRRRVT